MREFIGEGAFHSASTRKILPREDVRELDRIAIESFGMPGLLLMENAARGITELLLEWIKVPKLVLIFCGAGNNAGDGLALGRQLQLRNVPFEVVLCASPERLGGDALFQYELGRKLDFPMFHLWDADSESEVLARLNSLPAASVCVDALLGTGAVGPPRFPMAETIKWLNGQEAPILAVDIPTGLDCETGRPFAENKDFAVQAGRTVTLAAAKPGLLLPEAEPFTGEIFVSDIGIDVEKLLDFSRSKKPNS
ncbi:MAG: NAD(P)H-hydrate epimerase [Thermoguttaceae bacterium]|nr:NAD(P)H-hydrate epimerase [Thermoguttaceae bacterium]